jgi:hypothetical protein
VNADGNANSASRPPITLATTKRLGAKPLRLDPSRFALYRHAAERGQRLALEWPSDEQRRRHQVRTEEGAAPQLCSRQREYGDQPIFPGD